MTDTYRKGTLHFFHNTVVIRATEKQRWNTTVFKLQTDDETVDARNNVIWKQGSTHLTLMKSAGHAVFSNNWVSKSYTPWQYLKKKVGGTIKGEQQLITGSGSPFADADANDFRISSKSKAHAAGGALAEGLGAHAQAQQYELHQQVGARKTIGSGADLGALGVTP